MVEQIKLKISNEEKELFSETGDFISLPAQGGEIGIYPGHLRLFTTLNSGIIKIKQGEDFKDYEIQGGFAKIKEDQIEVFSSAFFNAESQEKGKEN